MRRCERFERDELIAHFKLGRMKQKNSCSGETSRKHTRWPASSLRARYQVTPYVQTIFKKIFSFEESPSPRNLHEIIF